MQFLKSQVHNPATSTTAVVAKTGRWAGLWRDHFAPLALYLLAAIIFTWPLALQFSDRVMSTRGGDIWQHLWNQWWMRFSLLDLHTHPYYTPLLFYPQGANLYFHALDPLDGYLGLPLQLLFGLVASFNTMLLLQTTIAGYATYLVARYLLGGKAHGAALVAGIIYAFCPLQSDLLNLGQLELTAIEWLPLYVFFFLQVTRAEPRPWLNRAACVLVLLLLSFTTWYYVLYALLFSGLYLLYRLWETRRERRAWLKMVASVAGIFAVYGVLVAPVLWPTLKEANSGGTLAAQDAFIVIYNSGDLSGFFRPGASAIWSIFGTTASTALRGQFLGFVVVALAVLGVITAWRRSRFWLLLAVIFALLALGPVLHWAINLDWSPAEPQEAKSGLPLPGYLLYNLPFGNIARVPLRFILVVMLGLAICAAFGVNWLQDRLARVRRLPGWSVTLVAGLLIFLEFLPVPRVLADTAISPFYGQIKNETAWNSFAVLELPDAVTPRAMYYQTAHQHPIIGGYLSRKPANYNFDTVPGLRWLTGWRNELINDIVSRDRMQLVPAVLSYYKIRYVVVHPNLLNGEEKTLITQRLREFFGSTAPTYQDNELVAYRVPDIGAVTADSWRNIYLELGDGWGNRLTGSSVSRPVKGSALLTLTNPYQTTVTVELRTNVSVQAGSRPLNLQIALNNVTQPIVEIAPDGTELRLKLILNPGLNRLSFSNSETDRTLVFGVFSINKI